MELLRSNKGQTLIEALVSLSVAVVVVGAISAVILNSLSSAISVKNQNLTTKYTQQGIEILRSMRNNNYATFSTLSGSYCLDSTCGSNDIGVNPKCSRVRAGNTPSAQCDSFSNNTAPYIREVTVTQNASNCTSPTASATPTLPPCSSPTPTPTPVVTTPVQSSAYGSTTPVYFIGADYNWGTKFTPNKDGTISKLWAKCSSGQPYTVRIYDDANGSILASVPITTTGTSTWVSGNITPLSVTAGHVYMVAARGLYCQITASTPPIPFIQGDVTINSAYYKAASDLKPDIGPLNAAMYGLTDITFTAGSGITPTPTPACQTPTPTSSPVIPGTQVSVSVFWSDSKCSADNLYCRKEKIDSCLSAPQDVVPLP